MSFVYLFQVRQGSGTWKIRNSTGQHQNANQRDFGKNWQDKWEEELASKIRLVDGKCPVCDSKVDHLNPLFVQEHIQKELDILKKKMDALNTQEVSVQEKKQALETIIKQAIKAEQTLTLHGVKNEQDLTLLREEISDLRRNVEKIPVEITTAGNLLQLAIDAHSSLIISKISSLIEETKD